MRRFGIDDVDHGLGAGEIHASVQEGALGELATERLPGSGLEERAETLPQHHGGAVALELGGVLAGVGVGAPGNGAEAEIQQLPVLVIQLSVEELAVGRFRHGFAVGGAEHPVYDGDGIRAGEAQNADGRHNAAGSDGGNGIV